MSKSKSNTTSSQTTNQTATTTPNTPDWLQQPWQGFTGQVNDLMNSGKPLVAGPSDLQQTAFNGAASLTTSPNYDWASQLGMGAATAGPNTAQGVTAGPAAQAGSRNFTDVNLQGYMNNGLNGLVDASAADYDATNAAARARAEAQAAWNGGTRNSTNAIGLGELEGSLSRAKNTGLSQIRYDAFNTAANLANNDLNREAANSQFNAGQQNSMSQFNTGQTNAMNQFNAGQQDNALARALQGAGLLANIGQAQGADQRANVALQGDLGAQQRDITNQTSEAARLAALQALLAGVPLQAFVGQTSTGQSNSSGTNTTTSSPSLLSQIGQGASTAASLAALFSDRRLKTDIRPSHKDGRGRQWYRYRYLWDRPGTVHEGVMAQEVMATDPLAVGERHGFLTVNYSMLEAA